MANADSDRNRPEWSGSNSSPDGINVTVGSSGAASFATGTTITFGASKQSRCRLVRGVLERREED